MGTDASVDLPSEASGARAVHEAVVAMNPGLELITWLYGGLNPFQEHGPSAIESLRQNLTRSCGMYIYIYIYIYMPRYRQQSHRTHFGSS